MNRIEGSNSRITMVVNDQEDSHDSNPLSELNRKDAWPTRSKEMKELALNKEMKELKIERAEHKRRIEQLEDQNDDLLLELASLRMNNSVSSVRSSAGTGLLYDGGGSENSMNESSFSVTTNTTANTKSNSNSNAAIPRRNSDAITFTRCSPHAANRRVTVGVTTPKAVKSCLSRTSSTLRRGSSMTGTSRRGSRRVTIASSSPYSASSGGSGGSGGSGSTNSTSSSRTARRRISSSSKDLLRICKGMALLQDDDDDEDDDKAPSSGGH